jgi:hypothetical protein
MAGGKKGDRMRGGAGWGGGGTCGRVQDRVARLGQPVYYSPDEEPPFYTSKIPLAADKAPQNILPLT